MSARKCSFGSLVRHAVHWDFLGSLSGAAVFLFFLLDSARPLPDEPGAVTAAIPLGLAVAVGAAVAARWLADRVKDDAYGEVIRVLDANESKAQRPYLVVTVAGIATTVGGMLLLIARGELGRTVTACAYGALLFLALYGVLGLTDLLLLGHRHQRRQARLRALREEENRRQEQ